MPYRLKASCVPQMTVGIEASMEAMTARIMVHQASLYLRAGMATGGADTGVQWHHVRCSGVVAPC